MKLFLDWKAIGYGFATFIAGMLAMSVIASVMATTGVLGTGKPSLGYLALLSYFVPVIAGYVAAYRAGSNRILNGTIGGSIGVLLSLAPAFVIPGSLLAGIPIIIASYAALASLGAIVGKHWRKKSGV